MRAAVPDARGSGLTELGDAAGFDRVGFYLLG